MSNFQALPTIRLTGAEPFQDSGRTDLPCALDFWRWSYSNLAANNIRGHLAEFLVATDLGLATGMRREWDSCDVRTECGFRLEIKSAAYIQCWAQSAPSRITFGVAPAKGWDAALGRRIDSSERNSDAFVFCLIDTKEQTIFDPMDLAQWKFFAISTKGLNESIGKQKTLSLARLMRLGPIECRFGRLRQALCDALGVKEI